MTSKKTAEPVLSEPIPIHETLVDGLVIDKREDKTTLFFYADRDLPTGTAGGKERVLVARIVVLPRSFAAVLQTPAFSGIVNGRHSPDILN